MDAASNTSLPLLNNRRVSCENGCYPLVIPKNTFDVINQTSHFFLR